MSTQKTFSVWGVLVILGTVCPVVSGGTWMLARTSLADELEQYRRSSQWKLPENLQQLGELSKRLNVTLAERNELDSLRNRARELESQAATIQAKLTEAEAGVTRLTERLRQFEGDTFQVEKGNVRFIVPGLLAVGVNDTSSTGRCSVQFGRESNYLAPGEPMEATVSGSRYTITLVKVMSNSCFFSTARSTPKR